MGGYRIEYRYCEIHEWKQYFVNKVYKTLLDAQQAISYYREHDRIYEYRIVTADGREVV